MKILKEEKTWVSLNTACRVKHFKNTKISIKYLISCRLENNRGIPQTTAFIKNVRRDSHEQMLLQTFSQSQRSESELEETPDRNIQSNRKGFHKTIILRGKCIFAFRNMPKHYDNISICFSDYFRMGSQMFDPPGGKLFLKFSEYYLAIQEIYNISL